MSYFVLQLQLQVLDGGTPRLGAVADLVVNVNRNLVAPAWDRNSYTQTILETKAVGEGILTVQAIDRDVFVSHTYIHTHTHTHTHIDTQTMSYGNMIDSLFLQEMDISIERTCLAFMTAIRYTILFFGINGLIILTFLIFYFLAVS